MKKIIIGASLLALTLSSVQSFGQVRFGVKGGLNVATLSADKGDYKSKVGFHIGGVAEVEVTDKFFIEPGLLFSMKGASMDAGSKTAKLSLNYMEIPVNALYKLDVDPIKIVFNAGPYAGIAVAASSSYDGKSEDIEIGKEGGLTRLDFGMNIGAGVEINNSITAGLQYGLGLKNINDDDVSIKNRVFGISVGYKFGK